MSPKLPSTPALILTPPWEQDRALDRFTLLRRARANPFDDSVSNPTLEAHLTHAMYHTCLRSMPRGNAPGPDGIPNEILQHLPEEAHEMFLGFFKLCWRARCTPPSWKHSNTLLFHKKGSPLHASNYRPIALHNNIFKLWTKIITNILQDFAERQGILHAGQEGFRHHKSTGRQLRLLTQTLEDSKLSNRNLFIAQLDFSSAFNSIDQPRLLHIMTSCGFPSDAVAIVQDLYTNATTTLSTGHTTSAPIPIRRGTIQGDTLSPFLFIVCLEPLLRWLSVNNRGYKCGTDVPGPPLYINALAYADDLILLANDERALQEQLSKVELFSKYTSMYLSPSKCTTSAILHGDFRIGTSKRAVNATRVQKILRHVTIYGSPIPIRNPSTPFKYLGMHFTLDLRWTPQLKESLAMIDTKGKALAAFPHLTVEQRLLIEEQNILGALRHTFSVTPFSFTQVAELDGRRARILKDMFAIRRTACTDYFFLPVDHLGAGSTSCKPVCAQVTAESLIQSLNDPGTLGKLTRAIMRTHVSTLAGDVTHTRPSLGSPCRLR